MMYGNAGIIPFKSRNNQIDLPMSPSAFCTQAQQYLTDITKVQNSLWNAHYLFETRSGDIWPDQCEDTIVLVRTISHPVYDFCLQMSNSELLPEIITPLRYSLMVKLHYMNKQIVDLIQLLTEFSAVCRTSLAQTAEQQLKVADQLKELSQSCDELRYRACTLFNQIDQDHFELASV